MNALDDKPEMVMVMERSDHQPRRGCFGVPDGLPVWRMEYLDAKGADDASL